MPEPAGLSTAGPTNGQVALGAEISLVASTENLNPVALVKVNLNLPPFSADPFKLARIGAGILNPGVESADAKLAEVKRIVAPVTVLSLKAVKSVYVTTPEAAAFVVVPPKVQVP